MEYTDAITSRADETIAKTYALLATMAQRRDAQGAKGKGKGGNGPRR